MSVMAGIAVVATAATLGDLIWYTIGVSHTITAGILHGALLLATVGAAIGATSGRMVKGLPIGAIAGVGGALSYYLLILLVDRRTYGTSCGCCSLPSRGAGFGVPLDGRGATLRFEAVSQQ